MRKTQHTLDPNIQEPQEAIEPETLDKIILLLISGLTAETVLATCQNQFQLEPKTATVAIRKAKKKIFLAAKYNPAEQIGVAITRLNSLYKQSLRVQDVKTALAAQKELNKLMDLYVSTGAQQPQTAAAGHDETIERVRMHLESLGLGTASDSVEELARRAAAEIINLRQHEA